MVGNWIFFGCIFSFLLGIQQLSGRSNAICKYTAVLFLCLSWSLFREFVGGVVILSGEEISIPILTPILSAAVVIHYYFRILSQEDFKIPDNRILVVLIISIGIVFDFFVIFRSQILEKENGDLILSLIHWAGGLFLIISICVSVIPVFLTVIKNKPSFSILYVLCMSLIIFLLILIGLIGIAINSESSSRIYSIGFTILIIIVFLLSKLRPEILNDFQTEMIKSKYKKSLLNNIDKHKLKINIDKLMSEEELYCESNCSLLFIAKRLKITPHQLSEFLNNDMNISFSSYINNLRIERAKVLLSTSPDKNILEIAFEIGFGNKMSFNDVFRKLTGTTPREYRNKADFLKYK